MGGRPNGALLKKTERKLKSPLGPHRMTEQPWRHGRSARYIRDPMTQGYRPGGACRSCGTIPRKSSRSPGPFLVVSHYTIWTTVCMYVWSSHIAEYGSTGQGCQSCSWSAEQGKLIFPCPRAGLRIWSRETGSAVPSRVSLLISILRLSLMLTYGIPPEFRGGVHL